MSITVNQGSRQEPTRIATKPAKPVIYWAAFGVVIMAVIAVTVGQWLFSPGFTPAPTGADPIPSGIQSWITALEVTSFSAVIAILWLSLIKPWIKTGSISWDGIFIIALFTLYYQDPIDNYFNFTFTYNAHFHNMSSWAPFIPGWESPRAENFAEPYLLMGSMFIWLFFIISVVACWLLNKFKTWLPNLSIIGHIGIIFLIVGTLDFLMESLFTHTQIFAYVAVYSPLSFWTGTPEQFPLYESTGIAMVGTGCALVRYFRDDHGQSIFERGMHHLRLPSPAKKLLSFFAIAAGLHLIVFIGFYGQYQWFALKADSFAKYPSYQIMEICGKGTPYACPTREVPMPKRSSLAISPDDPRLSEAAKRN